MIPQNEIDAFHAANAPLEGRFNHMYLDTHTPPLVTTGVGNLIDPLPLALELPWHIVDSGRERPAKDREVSAEWARLKNRPEVARLFAPFQKQRLGLTLFLAEADVDKLVERRLNENDEALKRVPEFASLDDWPLDARTAIRGMAWAMGAGFAYRGKWPAFRAACAAQNWSRAFETCRMREDDPTHKKHNDVNQALFRRAAGWAAA